MPFPLLGGGRPMADRYAPQPSAHAQSHLLRQASAWMDVYAGGWDEAVSSQLDLLRQAVDAAERASGPADAAGMAQVLQALGRLIRHLATQHTLPTCAPQSGFPRLSAEWFDLANDGSREFELAAAVAAIMDPDVGPLRLPVGRPLASALPPGEPVEGRAPSRPPLPSAWAPGEQTPLPRHTGVETGLAHTWTAALLAQLEAGAALALARLPLASARWATLSAVCGFLSAETADPRIEELFFGLTAADRPAEPSGPQPPEGSHVHPPRAYALLKLCLLPVSAGGGAWPSNPCLSRSRIVATLAQGDLFRACWLAAEELHAVGIAAAARAPGEGAIDPGWRDAAVDPLRLAAALLVPISPAEAERLIARL